jgi:hypothetical protein
VHISIGLADFNVSNYDWINGASLADSCYHTKIKDKLIATAICLLLLDEHNFIINRALLNLVFANISHLSASISFSPVVAPDN